MANRVFPANSLNLDGIPLSSTGVRPIQSPRLILNNRPPTPADANKSYPIGCIWVVLDRAATAPDQYEFWYLADNQTIPGALWLRFAVSTTGKFIAQITTTNDGDVCLPSGANNNVNFAGVNGIDVLTPVNLGDLITFGLAGSVAQSFPTDSGTAVPAANVLNIFGSVGGAGHTGDNINTSASGNTVVVALNKSLHMPASNASGTEGVWYTGAAGSPLVGGDPFISNIGIANTFVGELSGNLTMTTAEHNSGYGAGSLAFLTTGDDNTAGGYVSGASITTGSNNTLYGSEAGQSLTTFSNATAVGYGALGSLVTVSGAGSLGAGPVAIGYGALSSATAFAIDNQASVAVGQNALASVSDAGQGHTAVGLQAMQTFNSTSDALNTAVGHAAMNNLVSGGNNTALGGRAMNRLPAAASTGSNNTAVGCTAMGNFGNTTSITGSDNLAAGFASLGNIQSGARNVALGREALTNATNCIDSVAIGYQALATVGTSGADPTVAATLGNAIAIGSQALYSHTITSGANIAIGRYNLMTLDGNGSSTGAYCTSIGFRTLMISTSAIGNTALGAGVAQSILTGSYNVLIGNISASDTASVGGQYTGAESNNILIQNTGVTGESNVTRIGAGTGTGTGQQNKCFISGIRGITTAVNDAVAVLVDSANQLGTVSSSIRFKENIQDMGDDSSFINKLRPVTFNYKDRDVSQRSPGLIAEEVESIAPWLVAYEEDGVTPLSVRYHEMNVLLLNELQKLTNRVARLEDKLDNCCC